MWIVFDRKCIDHIAWRVCIHIYNLYLKSIVTLSRSTRTTQNETQSKQKQQRKLLCRSLIDIYISTSDWTTHQFPVSLSLCVFSVRRCVALSLTKKKKKEVLLSKKKKKSDKKFSNIYLFISIMFVFFSLFQQMQINARLTARSLGRNAIWSICHHQLSTVTTTYHRHQPNSGPSCPGAIRRVRSPNSSCVAVRTCVSEDR